MRKTYLAPKARMIEVCQDDVLLAGSPDLTIDSTPSSAPDYWTMGAKEISWDHSSNFDMEFDDEY